MAGPKLFDGECVSGNSQSTKETIRPPAIQPTPIGHVDPMTILELIMAGWKSRSKNPKSQVRTSSELTLPNS